MIEYKYPEEREILVHYAEKMKNEAVLNILQNNLVSNREQALELSKFYWSMLDVAAEDQGSGVPILEKEGIEQWMEYIFHSLNSYLVSNGYEQEWDQE
ncbi:hypothetical protein OQJ59_16570 [Microbulbifer thermotolerans]|uniref:hypothetical protein n=1 Tax=Microbulbifer thermotolerans TaxID=252514 RepID=UPI00224B8ECB|nr:hypothetical protein [Microbulbifer thermotolerans]MCX2843224.1 hypothetical protein [Microbulbifer thermotolerans]